MYRKKLFRIVFPNNISKKTLEIGEDRKTSKQLPISEIAVYDQCTNIPVQTFIIIGGIFLFLRSIGLEGFFVVQTGLTGTSLLILTSFMITARSFATSLLNRLLRILISSTC